jgi:hypothetical protein
MRSSGAMLSAAQAVGEGKAGVVVGDAHFFEQLESCLFVILAGLGEFIDEDRLADVVSSGTEEDCVVIDCHGEECGTELIEQCRWGVMDED